MYTGDVARLIYSMPAHGINARNIASLMMSRAELYGWAEPVALSFSFPHLFLQASRPVSSLSAVLCEVCRVISLSICLSIAGSPRRSSIPH